MKYQGFRTINNQLSAILNYAVKYYDLPKNPAVAAGKMGKAKSKELKNNSNRLDPILSESVIFLGKFYDAENVSEETWFSFLYKY